MMKNRSSRVGFKFRVFALSIVFVSFMIVRVAAGEPPKAFYLGADLSYVNEMEDCGAEYRVNGEVRDPYQIFHDYGANLIRLRLWNDPTWTDYSNLNDVIRSSKRAKDLGMGVLLDFHYSDTWADPSKQIIPAAWEKIADLDELGQSLYRYTYDTLMKLDSLGLMPEMVQVGNEINTEILRPENASGYPINWERNALLINRAIQAVRDAGAQGSISPRIMLHIAQPENVEGWFLAATDAGVTDYDLIGISYYPKWSTYSLDTVGKIINQVHYEFGKDVMVVETDYPWTTDDVAGSMPNDLGSDSLEKSYPATPDGQKQFLVNLAQNIFTSGGVGLVYWEPAWVSTNCRTPWGRGSSRDNATFFDFHNGNEVLPGIEFLNYDYQFPVEVLLKLTLDSDTLPDQVYFRGDFTGLGRRVLPISLEDGAYTLSGRFMPGTEIHYQFYSALPASAETQLLPTDCTNEQGYVTVTIPKNDVLVNQENAACPVLAS